MDNKVKKRGLGRGLSALIGNDLAASSVGNPIETKSEKESQPTAEETEKMQNGVQLMDIYQVEPDRSQPRQSFRDESLEELTASIRQYGVLQPLIVQKRDGFYQIIAGERRWRAAKNAGIEKIPVIVKEYNSEETLEISLIENIQREDLSPIEEAKAYKRLLEEYHLKQDEIAEKVGKSRSAIANFLRLLNLEESVQSMVAEGRISAGHAKVLLGISDKTKQKELAELIVQEDLSVRQLEKMLQGAHKRKEQEQDPVQELIYHSIGRRMQDILGTKVNIIQGKRKGKIEIEYYSPEDLERIMEMINQIGQVEP